MSELDLQDTQSVQEGDVDPNLDPDLEYVTDNMFFIDTRDMAWPLTMNQIRRRENNITFAPTPDLPFVESVGYQVLHESEIPTGGQVTEVTPQLVDGKWTRVYSMRPYTPEEIQGFIDTERQVRLQLLNERLAERLAMGYESVISGATHRINMSDANANDLSTQLRRAIQAVDRGQSTIFKLRTVDNQTLSLGPQDTVDLIDTVLAERQRILEVSWDLEDLLAASETIEEMPQIPAVLD